LEVNKVKDHELVWGSLSCPGLFPIADRTAVTTSFLESQSIGS
jgi:hypothetical protein